MVERTIDLARLRECDLRKGDLTSPGYRASLAGFVTHTANLDCNTSRRLSRRDLLLSFPNVPLFRPRFQLFEFV